MMQLERKQKVARLLQKQYIYDEQQVGKQKTLLCNAALRAQSEREALLRKTIFGTSWSGYVQTAGFDNN
jgi:hypothetical protein